MLRVIVESPYAGELTKNRLYAIRCLRDSLERGESPLLSHLLYPLVLTKYSIEERNRGMEAGWEWTEVAQLVAVYTDLGTTSGMQKGIQKGLDAGLDIDYRRIEP